MATQRALRVFPYNLTVGTDICHVVRICNILASSRGGRFVHKILGPEERDHPKIQRFIRSPKCEDQDASASVSNLTALELQVAATFMAGRYVSSLYTKLFINQRLIGPLRFAAKEAVIKAHPHRSLTWHQIGISNQPSAGAARVGAPRAIIKGVDEDCEALLSISHDGEYATAVCLGAFGT